MSLTTSGSGIIVRLARISVNFTGQNSQYKIDWNKSTTSCDEFKHQTARLLTLHVFQLLDVSGCVSGVDVAPVAVTEMPQDVFGVKG